MSTTARMPSQTTWVWLCEFFIDNASPITITNENKSPRNSLSFVLA